MQLIAGQKNILIIPWYAYPPPDGNILTNIVNALIAVPRFYTQVLHLMNKMNIPAPFRMALPTPPLPPAALVPPPPPPPRISEKSPLAEQSSSETEMESSDEEFDDKALYEASGAVKPRRKRVKREAIVGPAADKDIVHEGCWPETCLLELHSRETCTCAVHKEPGKEVVFDDFFYIFGKLAILDTCWMPIFSDFVSNRRDHCLEALIAAKSWPQYQVDGRREESGAKLSELAHQALCWLLSAFIK
ncbi:hypothetical protein D5086_033085 [Populus alba]|uniref:Uncharacterized protein n=1 Tax=Populus alba TaxID=43335 RepID=A0ACC4AFU5_POPAL